MGAEIPPYPRPKAGRATVRKKVLEEALAKDMTMADVTHKYGYTRHQINAAEKRHGIRLRRKFEWRQPVDPGDYYKLRHLTQTEAAKELGVTPQAACKAAKRLGFKFAERSGNPYDDFKTDDTKLEYEICHLLGDEAVVQFAYFLDEGDSVLEALIKLRKKGLR